MLNDLRNDIPNERASECPASLVAFLALSPSPSLGVGVGGGRASSLPKLSQAPEVAEHLPAGYELEHHVQVGIVLTSMWRRKRGERRNGDE